MTEPAIAIEGLAKEYSSGLWGRRRAALSPLHLSVQRGEVFGFLGPNGAGKTTTLKLLLGLIAPSAGTARILGMDFRDPRVKSRIGFLPEQPYFYDHLSASELLIYFAALSGMPAQVRRERAGAMLRRVGLADTGKLPLRKFSKGMLQRVGLAQAILHDPDVVFLDEPMSGLDPLGRMEVRDIIRELRADGRTVFFSTHILSDAEALCDRVAILDRGELCGVSSLEALTREVSGRVELVWTGNGRTTEIPFGVAAMAPETGTTGESARAIVAEAVSERALDSLQLAGMRLVSLTPVRLSLEEYFMARLRATRVSAEQADPQDNAILPREVARAAAAGAIR